MRAPFLLFLVSITSFLPINGYADTDCNFAGNSPEQNFKRCLDEANEGNPTAQSHLGYFYNTGTGVTQNQIEAANWYREAALQGDAIAQANLGFLYDSGQGVTQNPEEAAKWYQLASEQAVPMASYNLANMYTAGRGVTRDEYAAYTLLIRASEAGYKKAQDRLDLYNESWFRASGPKRKCGFSDSPEEFMAWYKKNNRTFSVIDEQFSGEKSVIKAITNIDNGKGKVTFYKGIILCHNNNKNNP